MNDIVLVNIGSLTKRCLVRAGRVSSWFGGTRFLARLDYSFPVDPDFEDPAADFWARVVRVVRVAPQMGPVQATCLPAWARTMRR